MAAGTEFGLLGPLTVRCDGTALTIPRGRLRAVLAALLLRANHVVSVDELAEVLWGADLPSSARVNVQNYVMRLRTTLEPTGSRITTQPRGYLIVVGDSELDLARFEGLLREARTAAGDGRWPETASRAAAALALWRGEPLADADSDVLIAREVPRLTELRLQAAETRIEADLNLARHSEVIGELRQLASMQPLRERLQALLMLALYRDRRRAEALATYRQARRTLVEELGAEPGPELQKLHQQILDADPALSFAAAVTAAAPAFAGPSRQTPPRQLPAAVAGFTGRAAELAALTRMLDDPGAGAPGTVLVSAIGGMAGVGKTTLAVHWAHQVAHRFVDGLLHVNLRGFDPSGTPATAAEAIRGFLDALGVPPADIPASPEAQAGLYRNLLADKRMLLVLDNARDEEQIRPLLPASPASMVLVTSRRQLGGLAAANGARLLMLDVLSRAEAVNMLTARLGADWAAAEPEAVDQIATLCAGLPLGLAVAAASAAARPTFPLAALAADLADAAGRLDALDTGDPASSVRAVFSWSTRQLSDEAARMFRLLGLHPGPDISVAAAASLADRPQAQARTLLRELAHAHLVAELLPGRYACHDLLRAFAGDQADHTDSQDERDGAIGRVLEYYLHTAARAALILTPAKEPIVLAPPRAGANPGQPADYPQALAWLEAEHQVLLAVISLAAGSGFDACAWQLPWAMSSFLATRGHWQDWASTQRTALAAATRLGDTEAQAMSGRLLAGACAELGDYEQSRGHFADCLALYQQLGNRLGEAKVQQNLSVLAGRQGRHAEALGHAEQALRLYQAIGDKASEAGALNSIGWDYGLLGDYEQARMFCRQAISLCEEIGDRWIEGNAWDSLGYAEQHLGNHDGAVACYQHALSLYEELGARFDQAISLVRLGDIREAADQPAQARQDWQRALAIFEDIKHPDAAQVRVKLANTDEPTAPGPPA
jgi:DNA-binding SARP family transcriptional activator